MSSSAMTLTLNGSYKMNGNVLTSGTILNITAGTSGLLIDGISYTEIQLVPESSSNTIKLYNGTRALSYLGSISLKSESSKIMAYNTIDIENYLKGVVPFEMSEYYPSEALKAQAVAARNFALKKIGSRASSGYDFDDTTLFQAYGGYNSNYSKANKAVDDTRGMVLLYNGQLVEASYSSSNGGYTEASENVWGSYLGYLRDKADLYDNVLWTKDISLSNQQIENTLKTKGYLVETDSFEKIDIGSITTFASGRINQLPVVYKDQLNMEFTKYIGKESARTFLALPSSMYTVTYDEAAGTYTFSGKGNGHGLGMSQIGAKNRALDGQTFDEILKFYYDGTNLVTIDNLPVPEVKLMNQSNTSYKPGETVSLTAACPNYSENVEYRVIIYNGTTKVSTQLYNTPSTGYYNSSHQQIGNSNYSINIPVNSMTPGTYSVTILARRAGTSVPYDSCVKTNSFTVEALEPPSRGGTTGSSIPKLSLITAPAKDYKSGDTISLAVSSPDYYSKVEYRVIIYNGTTKVTTQLYNTPSTGYYNSSNQQIGSTRYLINIPVKNMTPGTYSITILTRRAGTSVPYDSYVKTTSFIVEASSAGGTTNSSIPKLCMITPPASEYKSGDTISFTVSSPNYGGKVEYRVILYNGNTKKTSELWNTPLTGYYYKNWQPSGSYKFSIHWPVKGMEAGPYSITVLVRRVGAKVPYDSYVKTDTIWIRN